VQSVFCVAVSESPRALWSGSDPVEWTPIFPAFDDLQNEARKAETYRCNSSPSELTSLQTLFYAAIQPRGKPILPGLAALEPMLHCQRQPEASKRGSPAYRAACKGKLIRCLEDIYPVVKRGLWVGIISFGGTFTEQFIMTYAASVSPGPSGDLRR